MYDHSVLRGRGFSWWFWECLVLSMMLSGYPLRRRTSSKVFWCLLRNAVHQITCNNCNQHYIGSTIRFIHDRVREHLNNDNSSVKKHLSQCQNKVYKGIEIKSIVLENDPANLRLLEAFYIRKYKPTMNSREECSEFADLLFWQLF